MKTTTSTRDKILDTAIDLFSRSSFSAVSIRDITQTVGIKESSLYYHFKNKDELLDCIFALFREETRKVCPPVEALDTLLAGTAPDVFLRQGLSRFKAFICDSPRMSSITRIVSTEQFSHPTARALILEDLYEQYVDFLEVVFAKYIEAGRIRALPPRLLAAEYQYPIFTMVTQYQILQFDGRDTGAVERLMQEHVDYFIHTNQL